VLQRGSGRWRRQAEARANQRSKVRRSTRARAATCLDGLQLGRGAQHLFHHPAQLARQRREHGGQLVQQLTRGGARFLVRRTRAIARGGRRSRCATTARIPVWPRASSNRAGGGREHRVEDERERRKQQAQPLDLVGHWGCPWSRWDRRRPARRAGADRRQGDNPSPGRAPPEIAGRGPAQFVVLRGGDGG